MVIKVTAEDKTTTQEYTIELHKVSTEANITSVGSSLGTVEGTAVKEVPQSTKVSALKKALVLSTGATAEILDKTGGNAVANQDTTNVTATMVIKVTAEDKTTTQEYTIKLK